MLNFIFGFHRQNPPGIPGTEWMGNLNHFLLFIVFILSTILIYYVLPSKSKKSILITKIGLIIFLFTFEVGRMLWTAFRGHAIHGGWHYFDWVNTFSFTICAVHVWINIFVLTASIFVDSDNKTLQIFKNILFGSAAIGGLLSFIQPEHIDGGWHVLHWVNFQTIVIHAALVWVPLYFVKIGELKPRSENVKFAVMGFIGVYTFITMVSHLSAINFSWALGIFAVDSVLTVAFIPVFVYVMVFQIATIFYLPFEVRYRMKNKEDYAKEVAKRSFERENMTIKEKIYYILPRVTFVMMAIGTFAMPLLLGANMHFPTISTRAINEWYAVFIMAPVVIHVLMMYFSSYMMKKIKADRFNLEV